MSASVLFLVRDAAGNTYGPAEQARIVEWIGERRITPDMSIAAAGDPAFVAIVTHPLFASAFALLPPLPNPSPPPSPAVASATPSPPHPPTCGYAIAALFLALGGLFICPVLPSLFALWYARRSLRRIARENASGSTLLGGRRLAQAALVMALLGLLLGAGCLSAFTLAIFSR